MRVSVVEESITDKGCRPWARVSSRILRFVHARDWSPQVKSELVYSSNAVSPLVLSLFPVAVKLKYKIISPGVLMVNMESNS